MRIDDDARVNDTWETIFHLKVLDFIPPNKCRDLGSELGITFHWGQGVTYLAGPLRVHGGF